MHTDNLHRIKFKKPGVSWPVASVCLVYKEAMIARGLKSIVMPLQLQQRRQEKKTQACVSNDNLSWYCKHVLVIKQLRKISAEKITLTGEK